MPKGWGYIVAVINNDTIDKKLLDEPKLTCKRAFELAERAEAVANGQQEMRTPMKAESVITEFFFMQNNNNNNS